MSRAERYEVLSRRSTEAVECPACDGVGDYVVDEGTCPLCNGTGELSGVSLLALAERIRRLQVVADAAHYVIEGDDAGWPGHNSITRLRRDLAALEGQDHPPSKGGE